jgi:hypothetical protein
MKREHRPEAEFAGLLAEHQDIGDLHSKLEGVPGLVCRPDGEGSCLFKVYLEGRLGPYESFLRVNKELHKSYVQWRHQGDLSEECRAQWGTVVKNRSNPDGSELDPKVDVETIVRITTQYAELATRR